jgi:hypothetical protein
VTAAPYAVDSIYAVLWSAERIANDRNEGTKVGQAGPETIASGDMTGVKLTGAGSPQSFFWIRQRPYVEIADLWAVRGAESTDLSLTC